MPGMVIIEDVYIETDILCLYLQVSIFSACRVVLNHILYSTEYTVIIREPQWYNTGYHRRWYLGAHLLISAASC